MGERLDSHVRLSGDSCEYTICKRLLPGDLFIYLLFYIFYIHSHDYWLEMYSPQTKICFAHLEPLKNASKMYPSQTKMLEGLTKDEMRISKPFSFRGVSARFGLLTVEKCFENLHFIFCQTFQHLRLGSIRLVRISKIFVWGAYIWHLREMADARTIHDSDD